VARLMLPVTHSREKEETGWRDQLLPRPVWGEALLAGFAVTYLSSVACRPLRSMLMSGTFAGTRPGGDRPSAPLLAFLEQLSLCRPHQPDSLTTQQIWQFHRHNRDVGMTVVMPTSGQRRLCAVC
jgi:hypothetical protein